MMSPVRPLPDAAHNAPWAGWDFRQSSSLWALPRQQDVGGWYNERLWDKVAELTYGDSAFTEIDTADTMMALDPIECVAGHRADTDHPTTRITAAMQSTYFSFDEFARFIPDAGQHLIALDLSPTEGASQLSLDKMPKLAKLICDNCPKLRIFRIGLSEAQPAWERQDWENNDGLSDTWVGYHFKVIGGDDDIPPPPADLSFSGGRLWELDLYLCPKPKGKRDGYHSFHHARRFLSFNFVRSVACMLAPGGRLTLVDGATYTPCRSPRSFHELNDNPWTYVVKDATAFFHR